MQAQQIALYKQIGISLITLSISCTSLSSSLLYCCTLRKDSFIRLETVWKTKRKERRMMMINNTTKQLLLLAVTTTLVVTSSSVSATISPSSSSSSGVQQHSYTQTQQRTRQQKTRQRRHSIDVTTALRGGRVGGRVNRFLKSSGGAPPSTTTQSSSLSFPTDAAVGTVALTLIERAVNKLFIHFGIKFPAQLGGCGILFFFLVIADAVSPGSGTAIFKALTPGTTLLTKWLPVFFVPGLAMLPLAPSVGSGLEVRYVLNLYPF